jgi:hypothetical protein
MAMAMVAGVTAVVAAAEPAIGTGSLGIRGYRNDWTGRYPDADPVTAWDLEKGINVLWRLPTSKFGNGGPLVVGDRLIFIVEQAKVVCVDKMTGKVLWTSVGSSPEEYAGLFAVDPKATPWSRRRLKYGEHGGLTYASPVTDGKRIWLKLDNTAVCMDLSGGEQLWATPLHLAPGDHPHSTPSPLLVGDVLICQGGSTDYWQKNSANLIPAGVLSPNPSKGKFHQWLIGLDARTGKILWDIGPLNGSGYGLGGTPGPLVLDDSGKRRVFVVTHEGEVVDPQTGKLVLPSTGGRAGSTGPTPLGNRMLFKRCLIEFGLGQDGNPRVVKTVKLAREGGVYHNRRIYGSYRASDKHTRLMSVMDVDSGRELYSDVRIGPVGGLRPKDPKLDGSWDYPKLAVAGRFAFIGSTHTVAVVDISQDPPCPVALNRVERTHVAPVFDGDRTYLRTYDALYCIACKGRQGARYEQEVNAKELLSAFARLAEPGDTTKAATPKSKEPTTAKAKDPAVVEAERRVLVKQWGDRLRRVVASLPGTPEANQAEALLKAAQ